MKKKQTSKVTTSVSMLPGDGIAFSLTVRFDPNDVGLDRTLRVWQGVAFILTGVLEEEELPEFIAKFQRSLEAGKKKKGTPKA